jgi:hypothetical protein
MRSRWFSLLFPALFGLWLAPAHAALKFGTSENIRFVANITVPGPDGEKVYLARKITQKSFLLPYSIQDDGYVIGISGESKKYYPMPQGERLEALQRAGHLPSPLPPYQLETLDLVFGYSLWIFLLGCAVYGAYVYLKPKRGAPLPAPAAPTSAAPRPHSSYSGPAIVLPMRLYPRRLKTLGLLVFCIAAVAGGLFMAREQPLIGYLCAGFFALGIPVMLINLLPGQAYLELAEDGFTFAGVFRKNTIYWKDVAGFGVASVSGNKMVGWDFVPEYAPQKTGRAVASTLTGVQGALPDTYGMKAEQLSALMNELKRRSMGSPGDAAHG